MGIWYRLLSYAVFIACSYAALTMFDRAMATIFWRNQAVCDHTSSMTASNMLTSRSEEQHKASCTAAR